MLKTLLHVPASSESSMNTTILKVIFVCLFCVGPTYAQTSRAIQASESARADLARIKQAVLHGQINRCEIFWLPSTIEVAGALDPGSVEKAFQYKLEISLLDNRSKLMISLCKAIEETKIRRPDHYLGDLRWGCKLSGYTDKRVYTIFVDDLERVAVVNGKRMYFQGGIDAWFKSNFSNRLSDLGK